MRLHFFEPDSVREQREWEREIDAYHEELLEAAERERTSSVPEWKAENE